MRSELRHGLIDCAVVAALLSAARADWAVQSLYHSNFSLSEVILAMAGVAGAIAAALACIVFLGGRVGAWWARSVVLLIAAYILQGPLRAAGVFGQTALSVADKATILTVVMICAFTMAWWVQEVGWQRLRRSLVGACLIYALSPFAIAWLLAPTLHSDFYAYAPKFGPNATPKATLVFLLDEWSSETADVVAAALRDTGAKVEFTPITAVASNTIDAVPRMFGAGPLPNIKECTTSAVCAESTVFDFARLHHSPKQRVHIVGMFHPYCKSTGWISCFQQDAMPDIAIRSLACTFIRLVPLNTLRCDPIALEHWRDFRARTLDAVRQSPFWRDGGTLFAHIPLPHPPGDDPGRTLKDDYGNNVQSAARFVTEIWLKARNRFGDDARLLLTSDHPLRPNLWCRSADYKRAGCAVPSTWTVPRVPIMVAANHAFEWHPPASNASIFSPAAR